MDTTDPFIRWFDALGIDDVAAVGGKNASLGEMFRELGQQGVRVPNGFAITAAAYRATLDGAAAWPRLRAVLDGLLPDDVADLARRAAAARAIVRDAPLSAALEQQIRAAWRRLREQYGAGLAVAVRSSATAEDLPTASFAGQHESYLNVQGEEALLESVRRCFASLFTDRAIVYRSANGFAHDAVYLSVGVMKMVRADLGTSGVAFTLDPETGFRDVVLVTGAYGLGENIVQGSIDPDEFHVFKPALADGRRTLLRRRLGGKALRMVCDPAGATRNEAVAAAQRERYCLDDDAVLEVAQAAVAIERHYGTRAGHPVPMDVEWARDGIDGLIYIVQARPETVASRRSETALEEYRLDGAGPVLAAGQAVGTKIVAGPARLVANVDELAQLRPGEILVADTTMPDWGTVMKNAAGVVTNRGGRTCHAAIVARETGVPALVGCGDATTAIRTGALVTLSCAEGARGHVYAGQVPFHRISTDLATLAMPRTRLMVNIGNPDIAFATRRLPNDGVGLARMEFIIAEHVRAHPMALAHPERIIDPAVRAEIAWLTRHYPTPADYFVRELAEGVATIAAAFHPKPVIVRMSDFKTNEYASLLGGAGFEPSEANPMLGFRGAARYGHPAYEDGFALECRAMRRVREEMGLANVRLMIPFCRRVVEARKVLDTMARHGLARGRHGLEIYVMCEIPNNVIQIDAFAQLFDGFSIGSNDLTQLALGVDRDSEIVAFDFDERDPGVLELLRQAIVGARRNGRHVGICGQAPSDYPELARYLVEQGIDSISLNPDSVVATVRHLLEVERALGIAPRPPASGSAAESAA